MNLKPLMNSTVDRAILATVKLFTFFLRNLPLNIALNLVKAGLKLFFWLDSRWKNVALRNIRQVFPELSDRQQLEIYQQSVTELSRSVIDAARLPALTKSWVLENVEMPGLAKFLELKHASKVGVIIATGHLGSFELLGHLIGLLGYPVSVVVRSFRLPRLNSWWKESREKAGNQVIDRAGAFQTMTQQLESGRSVAMLFDQNVRRSHAVFVDFFGRPAATTKAVALAAIRTGAPIIVAGIRYDAAATRYVVEAKHCEVSDILEAELTNEERVKQITQRTTDYFAEFVRAFPAGWFWVHRRWKTAPEGQREDFYGKL